VTLRYFTLHYISFHFISLRTVTFRIVSYRFVLLHFVSFRSIWIRYRYETLHSNAIIQYCIPTAAVQEETDRSDLIPARLNTLGYKFSNKSCFLCLRLSDRRLCDYHKMLIVSSQTERDAIHARLNSECFCFCFLCSRLSDMTAATVT
jgi:hypothetical protein